MDGAPLAISAEGAIALTGEFLAGMAASYGIVMPRAAVDAYPMIMAAGAVLSLIQVARHTPRQELVTWLDMALVTLAGVLVGARLYFVLMHLDYYHQRPLEAPQVWLGGLDWPGAALGGLLAALAIALVMRQPLRQAADRLAHLAPPLGIAGWLGCWMAGCAYGPETTLFGLSTMGEDGRFSLRFPLQLLAALSLLIYYACLEIGVARPLPAGQRAGLVGLGLAVNLLIFSFLRADPAPLWGGLRADSWAAGLLSVFMLALCLLPSALARVRSRQKTPG